MYLDRYIKDFEENENRESLASLFLVYYKPVEVLRRISSNYETNNSFSFKIIQFTPLPKGAGMGGSPLRLL